MRASELPPQYREPTAVARKGLARRLVVLGAIATAAVIAAAAVLAVLQIRAQASRDSEDEIVVAQRQQQPPTPRPAPAQPQAQAPAQAQPPAQPAVPQRTERIVQDAWTITCVEMGTPGSKKTCSAQLQVIEKEHRRVVFSWVVGRTAEGVLTSVFQTQTGVRLQNGVEIKLGNANARRATYVICTNQMCEASLAMDDAMVREAMGALGGNAVATITAGDGRGIAFTMPIKGMDKALAAIGR